MGKIVHTYELLEQLGQGGMGVVYKARHIHFDEIYAIKRLWEQFSSNEMVLNLFLNEAKILRKLNHKNIVRVTDFFSLENQNYIVMEYIKGRSLDEVIKKEVGPIRRERAINLFKQMLEGVAYIHNQSETIIHRDIKPLNILVTEDDIVKITDFGIAKVLDAGQNASTLVKGTPVYMSPEQIIDPKSVDIRTDVYSLGMTFYEMLCGKTPFSGDTTTTPTAVYAAIMSGEVPPPTHYYPGISDALSNFVMKAIHRDRNQRFSNAREMLRELEQLERRGETVFQGVSGIIPPFVPKQMHESKNDFATVPTSVENYQSSPSPTQFRCTEMVIVEGGTFLMGSNDGMPSERPVHQVTIQSFFIGKYEVTQELWERVVGNNPSEFKGSRKPMESVSWYDVIEFCNKLSQMEGRQRAYSGNGSSICCDFNSNGYRLPTEAEWEFAARGGNKSKGYAYSGSNRLDEVAWYNVNSGKTTHEVGTKQPNELGVYDMSGNVWEWCWDWKGDYSLESKTNPRGDNPTASHVNRGGSWYSGAGFCRVAHRDAGSPVIKFNILGFRLARTK